MSRFDQFYQRYIAALAGQKVKTLVEVPVARQEFAICYDKTTKKVTFHRDTKGGEHINPAIEWMYHQRLWFRWNPALKGYEAYLDYLADHRPELRIEPTLYSFEADLVCP
jgi:hypothetical protein